MEFDKYFNIKTIIPSLEPKSKQEVIASLVDAIEKENKIPEGVNILSAIIERESVDSTGLGNGLALPHASVRDLNKVMTAVARIPDGIDFVAQDRKPVFFAIMICYPPTQNSIYLSLASSISTVFHKKENIQAVMKLTTAKAIYDKLLELLTKSDEPSKLIHPKKKISVNEEKPVTISSPFPEIHLLIRLQLHEEELKNNARGKKQIQMKIDNLRSLISEKTLQHYDKLKMKKPPAVVPIEGDRCHGCYMALHTDFVQRVRQETDNLYTCPTCRRFVYWI
ncbi:MAG: PTS sugar transporter subunit IIA [Candidatus Hydrogenedens sp.]